MTYDYSFEIKNDIDEVDIHLYFLVMILSMNKHLKKYVPEAKLVIAFKYLMVRTSYNFTICKRIIWLSNFDFNLHFMTYPQYGGRDKYLIWLPSAFYCIRLFPEKICDIFSGLIAIMSSSSPILIIFMIFQCWKYLGHWSKH